MAMEITTLSCFGFSSRITTNGVAANYVLCFVKDHSIHICSVLQKTLLLAPAGLLQRHVVCCEF